MYSSIFEEIGLSPNEAKIYETLLKNGETSVATIAAQARIHRRNVYDALNRLLEKGLVFQIFQKQENMYRAVHPQKLLEVVTEKQQQLQHVLPQLDALYSEQPMEEAAFIYKGVEGFKNYMRDMARVGEETYFLGAKGLWFTPTISQRFLQDFKKEMKRKKVNYYTLYDHRVLQDLPDVFADVGGKYKILPAKYSTPAVLDIFGDHVVTFSSVDVGNFGEDGTIFVMINKKLAESFKVWFRMLWDLCPGKARSS